MSRQHESAPDPWAGPIVPQGKTLVRAAGYSLPELERAGLTEVDAKRLGIPVDPGPASMIGANVLRLQSLPTT
jgi:ribosomal protein L13E